MMNSSKQDSQETAKTFILKNYPDCTGALLAGSVVRGEATETSDLDIIVFDKNRPSSFRETLRYQEWYIELFVYNLTSYKEFFKSDIDRAKPSLPRMVFEGKVLLDDGTGFIEMVKMEAENLLRDGPAAWSENTLRLKQYFLTDTLLDFEGSSSREEDIFIAGKLAELISEFYLRTRQAWIGDSKWLLRSLRQFDPSFSQRFVEAFDVFYRTGEKQKIMELSHEVLEPYGGLFYEGFSLGKGK